MPVYQAEEARDYLEPLEKMIDRLREEIKHDLLDQVTNIADLKQDSWTDIAVSDNFHLYAGRIVSGNYCVIVSTIDRKDQTDGQAVAQVVLWSDARDEMLTDVKAAPKNSASDGHIWIVQ
jgi:hypothetical protein